MGFHQGFSAWDQRWNGRRSSSPWLSCQNKARWFLRCRTIWTCWINLKFVQI